MEFWGLELKGNKPVTAEPMLGQYIRLTQATIAGSKKGSEIVTLFVKVKEQKLVLGRLDGENFPQLSFDLAFDTPFEVSHDSKNGTVHLLGHLIDAEDPSDEYPLFSSDEEDELGERLREQLKQAAKAGMDAEDESNEEFDDDSEEEDESDDEAGKKRPVPAEETPEAKKMKATEEKKSGGKAIANGAKSTKSAAQTPKSAGQATCGSCSKKFNNEKALQSHNKAKHSASK